MKRFQYIVLLLIILGSFTLETDGQSLPPIFNPIRNILPASNEAIFHSFGSRGLDIDGSSTGVLYRVRSTGQLAYSLSGEMRWKLVRDSRTDLQKVSIGKDMPCVIDEDQNIFKFQNERFVRLPGRAKEIAVTPNNVIYIISKRSWLPAGTLSDEAWGVYKWNDATSKWRKVSANGTTVEVLGVSGEKVYYTDPDDKIHEISFRGTRSSHRTLPGKALSIAGNGEDLYVVGLTRRLFRFDQGTNSWQLVPNTPNDLKTVTVAGDLAFALSLSGQVFKITVPDLSTRNFKSHLEASVSGIAATKKPTVTFNVLTIIWDFHEPGRGPLTVSKAEELIWSDQNSVRTYMSEISDNKLFLRNIATLGPYDARHLYEYYSTDSLNRRPADGWDRPARSKKTEAIQMADKDFDFSRFDFNGNGKLEPNELAICILIPSNHVAGAVRQAYSRDYPTMENLVVDGVEITSVIDMHIGGTPSKLLQDLGLISHELLHLVCNTQDMYFGMPYPYASGPFSLMDQEEYNTHLDPVHKLKLGWLNYKIVTSEGRYELEATSSGQKNSALIIGNPNRTMDEYFILEVRDSIGYDYALKDRDTGLAIWHVMERESVYSRLPHPPGTDPEKYAKEINFARKGIRLIQPNYTGGDAADFTKALWDGSDHRTGYDILPTNRMPYQAALLWSDGTPSGIEIRDISEAGQKMSFYIKLPTR